MRLATRVAASSAALTLGVVAAFGTLAYGGFVRQQDASMRRLLDDDLGRMAALLDRPVLGASFVDPAVPGTAVQIVAADGTTVLSWGAAAQLPLVASAAVRVLDGRRALVGSTPWRDGGATIRVAHDIEDALATRAELARSLWAGAAAAGLLAVWLAVSVARRALRPLARVADEARHVDPSAPGAIAYTGGDDELRVLTDALNETLAAIRDRSQRERAFLLEVAHELAGPLTLVHYHLAAARRERGDDEALRAAAEAAQELLRTSQDLLVVARGEDARPLELSVVALRDVLARVVRAYPGVVLEADEQGDVVADPDRLAQVFRNLVRNGAQAAGRAEGVRVTLVTSDDEHVVRVADDGPGGQSEVRAGGHRGAGHRDADADPGDHR
ncbi:MAG: HAMP domain-containing sensor histidine kinase, partial [Trueperaceae bacterium]|nr:HAMP domain-containing sensor histidine kinase [Trueperaceae bacterium]